MVKRKNDETANKRKNEADKITGRKDFKLSTMSPEEPLEKYELFLKITFKEGGHPHQLVAFGFNKLLTGWGPKEIVEKLSSKSLKTLADKLIMDYKEESKLPGYIVNYAFKPLKGKMDKKVEDVLEKRDSKNKYKKLLKKKVGGTKLKDYYGNNPEHNISDWSDKVGKRVLMKIRKRRLTREK